MGDSTSIEILEGESLEDAVKRLAGAMAPPKKAPAKKKASKKHKPVDVDPTPPVEVEIYAAFHMYLLEGRTVAKLRSDAARERQMYGPGVLVFIHAHQPGETCGADCAERVE